MPGPDCFVHLCLQVNTMLPTSMKYLAVVFFLSFGQDIARKTEEKSIHGRGNKRQILRYLRSDERQENYKRTLCLFLIYLHVQGNKSYGTINISHGNFWTETNTYRRELSEEVVAILTQEASVSALLICVVFYWRATYIRAIVSDSSAKH